MRLFELILSAQVWAASSTGAEAHSAPITHLIFPLINFLIFFYLLKRFLIPLIKNHLRTRREGILNAVKTADEDKERAEAVLRDYRGRLTRLDEETKEIRETLRTEGEREKAKLLREAEELALKIRGDANFLAQQEEKVARQQLREEIARKAQEAAERAIRANIRATDQERLIDEFLVGVGEAG
ncbi:MAG: hypothetical protein ACE5I0_01080 [Candidatus Binatia bacterium]